MVERDWFGLRLSAFRAAGIVTPAALAELDLAHYEALGISNPADRRKLFYLVQRIKMATDKPSYEQKEIDDIVSQTLHKGGDFYRDDDDDDEEGNKGKDATIAENSTAHPTSTSTLRSQVQKAKARETTATLRRPNDSDENIQLAMNSMSKSNVSTRTRNRALPVATSTMHKNGDDDENESSYNEVSDWAEESDVVVADDEASLSSRRTSRRLQEKKMKSIESILLLDRWRMRKKLVIAVNNETARHAEASARRLDSGTVVTQKRRRSACQPAA
ncbi:hypothetical protein MHU86_10069 [Fragilaria crotonensis]|nr:hypothetical protein MHU86_10069 [Fragilaria crotonensis]